MLLLPWIAAHCMRPLTRALAFGVLGLALGAFVSEGSLLEWLGAGLALGATLFAVQELVLRTSVSIVVPLVAAAAILSAVRTIALNAYPGAVANGALLALGLALLSWAWFAALGRRSGPAL